MDLSSKDEGHVDAPMNPDLPEFLVIPPHLWVGKTVSLHNGSGVCIAEGLVQNLRSNAIVGLLGQLGDSQIFVQVSHMFVEEEALDEWRYLFKSWPIQQVFLDRVSLFHHSKRNVYNIWLVEHSRPLGGRTRTYDNFTRKIPPPLSWNVEFLMTPQSINAIASNTCCSQSYVQHYPRAKIIVLQSCMYDKTMVHFRNHIKLDVHRQFHRNIMARNVVTFEDIDVCPFARIKIIGVSSIPMRSLQLSVMQRKTSATRVMHKPRSHIFLATTMLRAILDRHANHMPHKTCALLSEEKVIAKVLPANFKWKDEIPLIDEHLVDCWLPLLSASNLSKIWQLSYPEYYAKKPRDNFAQCSTCDDF